MKTSHLRLFFLFLIPALISFAPAKETPLKIALSKASPNYVNWIRKCNPEVIAVDLGSLKPDDAIKQLHTCSGLILTGGGDIDPRRYGAEDQLSVCTDIDASRDKLEMALVREALAVKMPVLGICRGEQLLNVMMNGTLISDIPSSRKSSVISHQCEDYLHCFHSVRIPPNTLLHEIIGADTGTVTTNHHQAALKPGKNILFTAFSPDSIVEGIEWKNKKNSSFMIGVQWHPERMDFSDVFSGHLILRFLTEAKNFSVITQNKH